MHLRCRQANIHALQIFVLILGLFIVCKRHFGTKLVILHLAIDHLDIIWWKSIGRNITRTMYLLKVLLLLQVSRHEIVLSILRLALIRVFFLHLEVLIVV